MSGRNKKIIAAVTYSHLDGWKKSWPGLDGLSTMTVWSYCCKLNRSASISFAYRVANSSMNDTTSNSCCWTRILFGSRTVYSPFQRASSYERALCVVCSGAVFLWPELTYNRGHVSFRPSYPLRPQQQQQPAWNSESIEQWDLSGKTNWNWKFRESRCPGCCTWDDQEKLCLSPSTRSSGTYTDWTVENYANQFFNSGGREIWLKGTSDGESVWSGWLGFVLEERA